MYSIFAVKMDDSIGRNTRPPVGNASLSVIDAQPSPTDAADDEIITTQHGAAKRYRVVYDSNTQMYKNTPYFTGFFLLCQVVCTIS